MALINGWTIFPVKAVMIVPNAAPMTTATARSTNVAAEDEVLEPFEHDDLLGGVSRGG
jgi:hypothetical protein